ncbi:hypothetical protein V6N13_133697 [Hibiscus sabdariffa]
MLMDRDRGCEGMIAFKLEDGAPKRTEIVASDVHSTLLQTILEIDTFTEISLSARGLLQMVIGSINRWNVGIRKEWFGSILLAGGTTSMQHLKERLEKYLLVEFPQAARVKVFAIWLAGELVSFFHLLQKTWDKGLHMKTMLYNSLMEAYNKALILDQRGRLILQVLSGQLQGSTPNLYDVVRVLLASGDNSVVTEIYIWHRYHLAVRSFYAIPCYDASLCSNSFDVLIGGGEIISEGKSFTVDNLVDKTSRQRQQAAENEHKLYHVKHTFEFLKPYLSSLIGVRETFLPLEKQFQTMERLFERLVAKTTLLEGEKR